jgi:UDP-glucose 4-epimerase
MLAAAGFLARAAAVSVAYRRHYSLRVRVAVVGGSGFVGRHVVTTFSQRDADVVTIDVREPVERKARERYARCDVTDLGRVAGVASAVGEVDVVVWLPARIRQDARVGENAREDIRMMVEAPLVFLRSLRGQPQSLVYLSSIQVYGYPIELPVRESHPTRPFTAYGVAKLCGENYLAIAGHQRGVAVASLRPSFIYGPGQHARNVIPVFLAAARRGEPPTVHRWGTDIRDDVHVRDVAAAVFSAAERGADGRYNVASGVPHTLREVAETVCRVAGNVSPRFTETASGWVDRWYSTDRARAAFGFAAAVDFAEGIREMWELESTP